MFLIPDFSRNDLTDFYELKSILTIRATRCTKCWSNIALKCYLNTFVKVDAQILDNCRRTIPYLKGYSYPKLHCKKLSNQEPMVNTVGTTRRTTLCCCGLRLNNFYSSNLVLMCLPFRDKSSQSEIQQLRKTKRRRFAPAKLCSMSFVSICPSVN